MAVRGLLEFVWVPGESQCLQCRAAAGFEVQPKQARHLVICLPCAQESCSSSEYNSLSGMTKLLSRGPQDLTASVASSRASAKCKKKLHMQKVKRGRIEPNFRDHEVFR
eukprot:scaffold304644_cov35-Prasinocladus_malaysianus.AAC.1